MCCGGLQIISMFMFFPVSETHYHAKLRLAAGCRIHQNIKGCDVLWKIKKTAWWQCNQFKCSLERNKCLLDPLSKESSPGVVMQKQDIQTAIFRKKDIQTARPYGNKVVMSLRRLRPKISRLTTVPVKNPNSIKPSLITKKKWSSPRVLASLTDKSVSQWACTIWSGWHTHSVHPCICLLHVDRA